MTDDRSLERAARSWLENGPTQAPDRAIEAALLRIETTPQERDWPVPWRLPKMTTPARVAAAAVIGVLAVGAAFLMLGRPGQTGVGGPGASPTATATPTPTASASPALTASPEGQLRAGMYVRTPFLEDGCPTPAQPWCTDGTIDDTIRITFTVPDGWSDFAGGVLVEPDPTTGASLLFVRGASLYNDPCRPEIGRAHV